MAKHITLTARTARFVCCRPSCRKDTVIFNDKLSDGRRSLKVWGWTDDDYDLCAHLLKIAGCKVEDKIAYRNNRYRIEKKIRRLVVTEPEGK